MSDATTNGGPGTDLARPELTTEERAVLTEAREWIDHEPSGPALALQRITAAPRRLLERVMDHDVVADAIESGSQRLLDQFVPWVQNLEVADHGLGEGFVAEHNDRADALRTAEDRADATLRRYRNALAAQGGATGAASVNLVATVAAFAADLTASTLGLLRATAEILACYGRRDDLEAASIATVVLAGESDREARRRGLITAARLDGAADRRSSDLAQVLAEQAGARLLNEAVESTLRRRVRQKALGAIPLVGAAAGAGLSAWMTTRAGDAARQVGRLSFLRRHAGITEATLTDG